jgi:hypothetical protein
VFLRRGRRILDEITAWIPAAGITVVSGPSGAGKTTLLRLCNRLEVPDAGTVCYRGKPLDELDPLALLRRVGMVFQRPTPFPGTVADNLAVARPDAAADKLGTVLERVALGPELLGQEARTLSGGELTPQIETTKATGLVFLPGATTGLILAGAPPAAGRPGPGRGSCSSPDRHGHHHGGDRPGPGPPLVHPDHRLVYPATAADHRTAW